MNENIDVSIVIVSYNTEKTTLNCVKSIMQSRTKFAFEVIIVDNDSRDNTVNSIREFFPQVNVICSEQNLGFSKGNNLGIQNSKGKYILLLNSDTLLFRTSIESLMLTAIRNNYCVCSPILLNMDHTVQRSWFDFPSTFKIFLRLTGIYKLFYRFSSSLLFKMLFPAKKPAFMLQKIDRDTQVDYLSFACVLLKRDIIEKIGVLDENLIFYHEDCEYGLRAKKNKISLYYTVDAKIIHLGGTSSSKFSMFSFENDIKGLIYVFKKYYSSRVFLYLKVSIFLTLQFRIVFWHFGFFRKIDKFDIYKDNNIDNDNIDRELLNKYIELKHYILKYK